MTCCTRPSSNSRSFSLALLAVVLGISSSALALPMVTSFTPAMGATGVARTTPLIVTFSEPMSPLATSSMFIDPVAGPLTVITTWNATNTRMTNTPAVAFAAGRMIFWSVDGYSGSGPLGGTTDGYFTTSAGGTGDCTNTMGSITLAKGSFYQQSSPASPGFNAGQPYAFVACSAIACSNWTTTNLSLALPSNQGTTNLPAETIAGRYNLTAVFSSVSALDAAFPDGGYTFHLQAPGSVTGLPLTLPATLTFPPAPHLTNYTAAQSVNGAQSFTLGWDPAPAAVDCIYVEIYGVLATPALGQANALTGAARTFTIPANTLTSNHTYTGAITFYDLVLVTNQYVSLAYRATTTEFSLVTAGASSPLVMTNCTVSGGVVSFEVISGVGQAMTIETNAVASGGTWSTFLTTNSPGGRIRVTDAMPAGNVRRFYRARQPTP